MWGSWAPVFQPRLPIDPEAKAKQEAMKKIEDSGRGECVHCKEEIVKNERGIWESEFLVEYCQDAKDHKHRPLLKFKETE